MAENTKKTETKEAPKPKEEQASYQAGNLSKIKEPK